MISRAKKCPTCDSPGEETCSDSWHYVMHCASCGVAEGEDHGPACTFTAFVAPTVTVSTLPPQVSFEIPHVTTEGEQLLGDLSEICQASLEALTPEELRAAIARETERSAAAYRQLNLLCEELQRRVALTSQLKPCPRGCTSGKCIACTPKTRDPELEGWRR